MEFDAYIPNIFSIYCLYNVLVIIPPPHCLFVKTKVYNQTGKQVATLLNEWQALPTLVRCHASRPRFRMAYLKSQWWNWIVASRKPSVLVWQRPYTKAVRIGKVRMETGHKRFSMPRQNPTRHYSSRPPEVEPRPTKTSFPLTSLVVLATSTFM